MAENSAIEWTDHTFNPWMGCTKVSRGCKHCYAETLMDKRYGKAKWGQTGDRILTSDANWRKPLAWNRQAQKEGRRFRVFCASLADVFEHKPNQLDDMDMWRGRLFNLINSTPHLDWLILTKRPELVNDTIERVTGFSESDMWFYTARNVWIGTSIESQEMANERIPEILNVPAAVRFLSVEPLVSALDLAWLYLPPIGDGSRYHMVDRLHDTHGGSLARLDVTGISWVIVGGESGDGAAPMHPNWARSLRDQCVEANVPFLFKQWGEWLPLASADEASQYPKAQMIEGDGVRFVKVGKKAAGRLLDGREWNQYPNGG